GRVAVNPTPAATSLSPLVRRARELLPGGQVAAVGTPDGTQRVIARGLGSRVWDVDGNEFVDYLLGSGPMILGHAHPAVVEAVAQRMQLGSTFYFPNDAIVDLAEHMVERIPCAEMIQFCTSGAEATHYALRFARAATGRDAVVKFEGGFHGTN